MCRVPEYVHSELEVLHFYIIMETPNTIIIIIREKTKFMCFYIYYNNTVYYY